MAQATEQTLFPTNASRVIVALDVASLEDLSALLGKLGREVTRVKVGLELYLAEGRRALDLASDGRKVFLDLKLHDIPETVGRAVATINHPAIDLMTLHTAGGAAMMAAAARGRDAARGPRLLGVTVLTSLDEGDLIATGCESVLGDLVERRARLAVSSGLDGVVCAPTDVERVRSAVPRDFLVVTPGVRAGAGGDDQKRVATARDAIRFGSSALVVGRPIRDASDPAAAFRQIVSEIESEIQ